VAEIARQIKKNYQDNHHEYLLHDGTPMNADNLLNITMGGIPAIQQITPVSISPMPRSVSRLSNKSKGRSASAKSFKSKRSSKPISVITAQQMIAQIQDQEQTPITE